MPVYVYQCPVCENVEELKLNYEKSEFFKPYCDSCKQESGKEVIMRKLITSSAIIFKGKGFYSTDNRVEKIPRKVKDWQ